MLDAASIMTRNVVTARPTDTVARVARLLADNTISAVPVCDDTGALLGMISEGDLMRPFVDTNVRRRAWWLALLADGTDLAPEFVDYVRLDRHQIGDLMTKPVITASETAHVTELAEQMVEHRIKRLPIVRDGKLTLGNLDAARDWGHARDYVEAMRRMLQLDEADDFVIGTGKLRTVRDLCLAAYGYVGKDWTQFVRTDPRFLRLNETGPTVANAAKAHQQLDWVPTISFEDMIAEMVDARVAALQAAGPTQR